MIACNLAKSVTKPVSESFPPVLMRTNSKAALERLRISLTSPTARNEAALTRTTISARAPQSIGSGISTKQP
jgi:hypothetical protein